MALTAFLPLRLMAKVIRAVGHNKGNNIHNEADLIKYQ